MIEEAVAESRAPDGCRSSRSAAITRSPIRFCAGCDRTYRSLTILQIDAHPDLYDEFEGDRFSHACPFARIMEEGLADAAGAGRDPRDDRARPRSGAAVWRRADRHARLGRRRPAVDGRAMSTCRSISTVSIPRSRRASRIASRAASRVREVLTMLDTLGGELIGADIVEFNPQRGRRRPHRERRREAREGTGGAVRRRERLSGGDRSGRRRRQPRCSASGRPSRSSSAT